jgi:hypothetical protein
MMHNTEAWRDWLSAFRARYIEEQGWSEKEAKWRIRDAWAVVRGAHLHVLTGGDQRPVDAIPIFEVLTLGGFEPPIGIVERLTGLVSKAMTSQRAPRDIVMGILEQALHTEGKDESEETTRYRHTAALWVERLLAVCEHEELSGVAGSDVFWSTLLAALFVGRRITVLELYKDPQAFHDLIKVQAFQSGKSQSELSRCLETSLLELRADLEREPTAREVFKAAGGVESKIDECWDFEDLKGMPSIPTGALYDRLEKIRRRNS